MKLLSQVLCQFRSTQSIIIYFLRCSICSSFLRLKELTAGAEAPLHPQGPWSRPQQPKLLATPGWGSSLHSWSWPPGQAPLIRNVLVKAVLHMISPHTAVNLCPWPLPQQGWHVGGNTPSMKEEWGPSPAEEASPEALKATTLLILHPDLQLLSVPAWASLRMQSWVQLHRQHALENPQQNQLTRSAPWTSIKWPERGWDITKTVFWIQAKEWSAWEKDAQQNWENWLLGPRQTFEICYDSQHVNIRSLNFLTKSIFTYIGPRTAYHNHK